MILIYLYIDSEELVEKGHISDAFVRKTNVKYCTTHY